MMISLQKNATLAIKLGPMAESRLANRDAYLGAVFPGDPVSQPNQSPLNARQSAGSPEPSRKALHEGHRRVASIA